MRGKASSKRHQAFLTAGWSTGPDGTEPFAALISNFSYDHQGRPEEHAAERLGIARLPTPADQISIFSTGRVLGREKKAKVVRALHGLARRGGSHPLDIAAILGAEIGDRAKWDKGVGRNLMVVSIPRIAAGHAVSCVAAREAWRTGLCAAYQGEDDGYFHYMPAIVLPHFAIAEVWGTNDPDSYPLGPLKRRPFVLGKVLRSERRIQ